MGIVSKVISTVRKIDSIHAMVEGAVKKIDEVYVFVEGQRHLVFPESTLIFEKTTAGSYEFTVPEKYNFISIEIAGGNGGQGAIWAYAEGKWVAVGVGGKGEKIVIEKTSLENRNVSIVIGQNGQVPQNGGSGYSFGEDGVKKTPGGSDQRGGGGGGSSAVVLDGVVYEASGGGGVTLNGYYGGYFHATGGKGGGPKGGSAGASKNVQDEATSGGNATGSLLNQTNSGYVKIYGIAG